MTCIGEVEAQTHMLLYELCYISHQYPGRNINNLFMYIFEIKKTTKTDYNADDENEDGM